jgi:hypothetical protein
MRLGLARVMTIPSFVLSTEHTVAPSVVVTRLLGRSLVVRLTGPSVGDLTDADRRNILAWYEATMDWVPKSISFAIKHQPRFLKSQRAKWEACFVSLPKQVAPFLMLAQHTVTGYREGVREGALLAKAWGFTPSRVLEPITGQAYYFKGMEALEAVHDAIDDILDDWGRQISRASVVRLLTDDSRASGAAD